MTSTTLLIAAAFAFVNAAIVGYVGRQVAGRRVSDQAQRAVAMFAVWWYGLAAYWVVGGASATVAAFGYDGVAEHMVFLFATLLALCVMLWGLGYYLLYLFTGTSRWFWPLTYFYAAYFALMTYLAQLAAPVGVDVGRWEAVLRYQRESFTGSFAGIILFFLVLPQVVGAVAYFFLLVKAEGRLQKYRIGLVAGTVFVWFGSSVVASLAAVDQEEWWQVTSRLVNLAAVLLILMAYRPPAAIRRRLERA